MITVENAISAIESKLEELTQINSVEDFNTWHPGALITISKIFPEDKKMLEKFENIEAYRFVAVSGYERLSDAKKEATALLNSLISDLSSFGLPASKNDSKKGGIHINLTQSNNQSTTIHLNIIVDAVKDELNGRQLRELQEIMDSEQKPDEKRRSILDKLKSFGSDVASNIVANILTNPELYSALG